MANDRMTETADMVQQAYLLLLRALAREHGNSPDKHDVGKALHLVSAGKAELVFHMACDGVKIAFLAQACDPASDATMTLAQFNITAADEAAPMN